MTLYSPAEIIAAILAESSSAWPTYVSALPAGTEAEAGEDNVVAVYDTAGLLSFRTTPALANYFRYGVQVRVRATDYSTAWAHIVGIAALLAGVLNYTVTMPDGTTQTVNLVTQTSTPLSLGQDAKRRAGLTLNFLVMFNNR